MQHCQKKNTPTAIGVSADGRFATAVKLGCKMWDCPYCSTMRKFYLSRKAYFGIEHYKEGGVKNWYFGTLTMHENWRGWASIQNYQANWNKFYQRMKRANDGPLYYVILPEHHKDRSLHIHLISTCQNETRWWKDQGRACGFGYKNENEPLGESWRAVSYVLKYVGKSLGVAAWPKHFRRVRFSIHWPPTPIDDAWSWSCIPANAAAAAINLERDKGRTIINAITGQISEQSPTSHRIPYPNLHAGAGALQGSAFLASFRVGETQD